MSAPVNTAKVINHVTKREPKIDNDMLIKLAGGSSDQWGIYLKGPRVAAIVRACNTIMQEENKALVSEGIHSEQWQLVTVAEKNRREAEYNLRRADAHFRNAFDSMQAIVDDVRAPKKLRADAQAWIELASEPRTEGGILLLKEFAAELADATSGHRSEIRLLKQDAAA